MGEREDKNLYNKRDDTFKMKELEDKLGLITGKGCITVHRMKEKLENVRKKSSSSKRLLKEVTKIFFLRP